jgi:16S rRNA (guanine527-N7)-methyltransferase
MDIVFKYFPFLSDIQIDQFRKLESLYRDWNSKINVISRKDIDHLAERHVLHSLGIAKLIQFINSTKILDVGTGGGFPGIPLAIFFPEVTFHLVDSIGKKIKVVKEISGALNLQNLLATQTRAEVIKGKYDFIVSRAVANLPEFYRLVSHLITDHGTNTIPNGILYLKGGEFTNELKPLKHKYTVTNLSDYFDEEFFETKKIVHIY